MSFSLAFVVMRARLQGFLPVRVGRFLAGRIERFNFFSSPRGAQALVQVPPPA